MAASTKPTSTWVSSYKDKNDEWVQARLEHLEGLERISLAGSVPRRKEIRVLRVELLNRKKNAQGPASDEANAPVPAGLLEAGAAVLSAQVAGSQRQSKASAVRH